MIRGIGFVLLLSVAGVARGADYNFDFGAAGTAPASTYAAAAGTVGTWNVLSSLNGSTPSAGFVDTLNNPTPLSIGSSTNLFAVTPSSQPFTGATADLLGDYLVSSANGFTLTFDGLSSGEYRVYTYTVGRQDFPQASTVTPFGNTALTATNTGIWSGSLEQGVTHSVHDLVVTSGGFTLDIFSPADGFVSGVQITSVPEPAVGGVLGAAAATLLLSRGKRRSER